MFNRPWAVVFLFYSELLQMYGIVQECKEFSILCTFPDSVYRRFAKAWNKKRKEAAQGLNWIEKLFIVQADKASNLNKRTESISKCRYENKYSLVNGTFWLSDFLSDERLGAKFRVTENRCVLFFNLCILSSATTALSTLCQGRLYPHIYIYIWEISYYMTFWRQRTNNTRGESSIIF